MRIPFALMLASIATCSGDTLQTADLAKLRDPATREAEAARLAGCDLERRALKRCVFLTAPQPGGNPPLHVLTVAEESVWSAESSVFGGYQIENPEELFAGTGRSAAFQSEPGLEPVRDSQLLVFDSTGKEIRPFGGNNFTEEGYYFDFNHDGILDRADSTRYGVDEAPDDSVQVFELETVEPKPRTLLQVVFNWHPDSASDENNWGFTCFDDNNDGFAEIAFGPASAVKQEDQRKFVFRWDPDRQCYSAGDIPAHSHIRVMKPGESLASIAKSGKLGYPVIRDSSNSNSDDPAPPVPQAPYVFRSFKDRPAAELAAFFQGAKHRDSFDEPGDAVPNQLPENLWNLSPKQAAIAIAEANRTPSHRAKWQLAMDDRHGVAPPASGWLTHRWSSSGCYSFSSHFFVLRFGVPAPVLTVFGYNSIGVVGRNPLADQPARNVRFIKLAEKEARFIADTVFWLDRIRSFSPVKNRNSFGMRSSTADGFATVTFYPDHEIPRDVADGTVWATSSISGNWTEAYDQTTFVNLAELLIADGVPKMLGERWDVAPEIDYQNLATPTDVRLAPRVDNDARQQLVETYRALLDHHARDPLPAAALAMLIGDAGGEALTELRPAFESMFAALPAETAEDREFAALEKRFERDHFGNPLGDEAAVDHKTAHARYTKLRAEREFLPAAVLREPLQDAIARLRLAQNTANLMNAAAEDGPDSTWALGQLRRIDAGAWAGIVASGFHKADVESRRAIIDTLTAGRPDQVKPLIAELPPAEYRDLIIGITEYHRKQDAASLAKDVPVLMSLLRDSKVGFLQRGSAMSLLAELDLTTETRSEFIALLEKEIRNPQKGEYGMDTLEEAVSALTRISPGADHLDLITRTPGIGHRAFETGFQAILTMAGNRPDRDRLLADYIRPRFATSEGMMNDIFLHVLAFDLRELAPDIAAFATEGPSIADGDGADYSGGNFKGPTGQRYHLAREITALWTESDPATLGRMWAFFAASRSSAFNPQDGHSRMEQTLRELAARNLKRMPSAQRKEAVFSALTHIPVPAYAAGTEKWLRQLAGEGDAEK